jgi:hypothetical protein
MMSRALLLLVFRACCFCLITRSLQLSLPGIAPTLGAKSKRISLVADLPSIIDPTSSGAADAVFVVLGLVVGQNPIRHFLSKRIS